MESETILVLKGFDVVVLPSEEEGDNFEVTLSEGGNEVYQVVIPIPVDEDSDEAYSEDYIAYAAQAAVDIYEAGRETLGEGAGVTMKEGRKKQACVTMEWEDWYLKLKGTLYEQQATVLLEQYMELSAPEDDSFNQPATNFYADEERIYYELDVLNFERLKATDPNQTVIIINASKRTAYRLYSASDIQDFLDKFSTCGGDLEIRAIAKVKELLDIRVLIQNQEVVGEDSWEKRQDLESAMNELLLQCIQEHAIESAPATGMGAAPAMAADIAELMEGVEIDAPLESMIAGKKGFEETEEEHLVELGEQHEGLDPAEIPLSDRKFQEGDDVTFSEEYESTTFGGIPYSIPKGTKGTVDSLWDGSGDLVLVVLKDEGSVVRVPMSALK